MSDPTPLPEDERVGTGSVAGSAAPPSGRRRYFIEATAGLVVLVVTALGGYVMWVLHRPIEPGAELYRIAAGDSLTSFARTLEREDLVPEIYSLVAWARLRGDARRIKAGEYRLDDVGNVRGILERIVRGDVVAYRVTVVEGWTFRELLARLASSPKLKITLDGQSAQAVMEALGRPGEHPEGRFFPDTYTYTSDQTDLEILARAYERMRGVLAAEWERRDPATPLGTPYEALILASIVEKETALASERELVAGVFVNRLQRGIRLQTDPTVIYGLGEAFTGNLTRKHLRADTPYNTYTRAGLPPTPIALPGAASIRAALRPAPTDALYFVARGDGSHEFSETLEQHNRAVYRYQIRPARASGAQSGD